MWSCARYGYSYKIEKGSYEGQIRKQLDHLAVVIENPGIRPLAVSMPESSSIPAPTSEEKIQAYFYEYWLPTQKGRRKTTPMDSISRQLDRLIYLLNVSGEPPTRLV